MKKENHQGKNGASHRDILEKAPDRLETNICSTEKIVMRENRETELCRYSL